MDSRTLPGCVVWDLSTLAVKNGRSFVPRSMVSFRNCDFPTRKLKAKTCLKWGYGWNDSLECHVATYCDDSGEPVAQKLRFQDKQFEWRGDPGKARLWGRHLWPKGGRMIIVTEGEPDCMSVSQVGDNKWATSSIPHGASSAATSVAKDLDWLESFERVVFMYDMDDAGRKAARECARLLTPGKACIAHLPLHDASDMLVEGQGDRIVKCAWNAKPWKPEGILEGESLWRTLDASLEPGFITFPFPDLQYQTLGIRRGEIVLFGAAIFGGKSTICRQFASHWIDEGIRVGVIPLEETPGEFLRGLLGVRVKRNVKLDDPREMNLREHFDPIAKQIVCYDDRGDRTKTTILDQVRYMALADPVDIIILDHMTVMIGSQAENSNDVKYADQLMAALEALVKRTRVSMFIVQHLKQPAKGQTFEEGRMVTMSAIRRFKTYHLGEKLPNHSLPTNPSLLFGTLRSSPSRR